MHRWSIAVVCDSQSDPVPLSSPDRAVGHKADSDVRTEEGTQKDEPALYQNESSIRTKEVMWNVYSA